MSNILDNFKCPYHMDAIFVNQEELTNHMSTVHWKGLDENFKPCGDDTVI